MHLVALEAVINKNGVYSHAVSLHHRHTSGHSWRHGKTLDLDEIAHVLASGRVRELTLHLLLHGHLLLHLELDVVEHTIEIYWIELHGDLYCRVLLEMHQRLLALLGINHSCGTFDALSLFHRDLFSIEDHQLDESLDDNHAVVGLPCDRVVDQGEVEQVR